jgi:dihydropteroate synthase
MDDVVCMLTELTRVQVARLGVPYVLMHMRGDPTTMQLPENTKYPLGTVEGVADELRAAAESAIAAGIEPWRLVLDPGKPDGAGNAMGTYGIACLG